MSITLAAIIKNEEQSITGMIQSVRSIVDEVVIVDTGSTDHTLEIVTPLVDKVLSYNFTNFGDVRTYALRQATREWILMLDADERILIDDLPKIQKMTEQTVYDAWMLPRHQWDNLENKPNGPRAQAVENRFYPDWQTRLFKNTPSMQYIHRVHETLAGYKNRGRLPLHESPHIQHCVYYFKDERRIAESYSLYNRLLKGQ